MPFKAYEGEVMDEIKRKVSVSKYITEKAMVNFMKRIPCFDASWWEWTKGSQKKQQKDWNVIFFFFFSLYTYSLYAGKYCEDTTSKELSKWKNHPSPSVMQDRNKLSKGVVIF